MITRIVNKLIRMARQPIRRSQAKTAVTQLTSSSTPQVAAIGEALRDTLSNTLTSDEQAALQRIEQRRRALLSSTREIPKLDFGAGSPKSKRSKEEMEKGVASTSRVADIAKASKPEFWAIFLFKLVRKLQPTSCVELGTCVGISAAYQAVAQQMNGQGKLVTLEGSPDTAKIARETLETMGLDNGSVVVGPFHETLDGVLKSSQPIDYFFNDGHHDHDAVLRYFNEAMPFLASDAIVVFDDISWSADMREAWEKIERDERVAAAIDLEEVGIALMGERTSGSQKFRIPL